MRLQIALARHAGIGRQRPLDGWDPRKLSLPDLDYMVLTAIAAPDGKAFPYLNQHQVATLLQESGDGGVCNSIARLVKLSFCREFTREERVALGLPSDKRMKYYGVTDGGIQALLEYESVRFALPDEVAQAVHPLPEYKVITDGLSKSIAAVLAQEFASIGGGGLMAFASAVPRPPP
jgi:hypothetical protein